MNGYIITFLVLAVAALLVWLNQTRGQVVQLRASVRQAQREQEAVLSLIDRLGEKITSKIDVPETLRIITEFVVQATKAQSGAIYLVRRGEGAMAEADGEAGAEEAEEDQRAMLVASVVQGPFPPLHLPEGPLPPGRSAAELVLSTPIPIGEGIVGLVAEQGEALLVTDAEADPRVPRQATQLSRIHTMILCPLRVRGRALGVLVVVNKLGQVQFEPRDLALLQALADQAAITVDLVKLYDVLAEQQRLEQELAVAHDFQKMLLPEEFPELPGYEISALSEAATVVGGDFYDFFQIDEEHLGLVIADVSGKGIPGALIMAMTRSVLRAEARGCLSPREALRRVNERVFADTKDNVFITMIYGVLDLPRRKLRFVRAGHEPLLLLGPPQVADGANPAPGASANAPADFKQVAPEGIALGMVAGEMFDHNEEAEIELHPGEVVVLYTDGVIEAMDRASREYGRERLQTRLRAASRGSAQGLIREIVEDIHRFTRGIPQHDDITLLALRVPLGSDAGRGAERRRAPGAAPGEGLACAAKEQTA